jgi:UDPglucose 6-dehydrogenase
MKVGIIGNGFVGQATQLLEGDNVELLVYDIVPEKCRPVGCTIQDLGACDVIFIAVPTPMKPDGSCHTSIVESVIQQLKSELNDPQIFVRSTVPVGTCDRLGVNFMPEFLTEKRWRMDFIENKHWICGLLDTKNEQLKQTMTSLFNYAHQNGSIQSNSVEFCSNKEAELLKYFRNSFLAVKVSFCNEIEEFCRKLNIDYTELNRMFLYDDRIGNSHSSVPGHDGRRGFGGTCLPKDTSSLLRQMERAGVKSYILDASIRRNDEVDRSSGDWKEDKCRSYVG